FATLAAVTLPVRAQIAGEWTHHPPLDINSYLFPTVSQATNNVQRLIDTDRYLYALITGSHYQEDAAEWYRLPPMIPARYDKSIPDGSMQPLSNFFTLSGIGVNAMGYSHAAGCLAIAYDNSAIDIIFDDGRILSNTDLLNTIRPGGIAIRDIAFSIDGSKIVTATDFGALIIDTHNASTFAIVQTGSHADCANIVGNRLIISDGTGILSTPLRQGTYRVKDLTPLRSSSDLSHPRLLTPEGDILLRYGIYPVSDDSFLFIGPEYQSGAEGLSANILTIPADAGDPCGVQSLFTTPVNFAIMGCREDYVKGAPERYLISPTADGLMLHTNQRIYLLRLQDIISGKLTPGDLSGSLSQTLSIINKESLPWPDGMTGAETFKQFASADGRNFYVFRPREGFQRRTWDNSEGSGKWSDSGDIIPVNALAAGMPRHLYYNPGYGLLVHNRGRNSDNRSLLTSITDGVCTFADGKWTRRSLGTTHRDNYFSGYSLILESPSGGVCDPLNPDHIYTVSRTTGMRRQNLADPADALHFTRSNHLPDYPRHITVTEPQTGSSWSSLCSFAIPDFDNDGTLWTAFARNRSDAYPEPQAELWYWSAADRQAVNTPEDYPSHPFGRIIIPDLTIGQCAEIHSLRHPANRNIIAHISHENGVLSLFYDHNGTPEDTSDDHLVLLNNGLDQYGE
ncbi:MAG: hypothetical protein K2K29_02935, partial [Muribaculaceae bacterium]|nr:hypothetical protein [Muribaculaceae bacterium]